MDTALVRTAVKVLTTLQGKMHDEWFQHTGREFRWAVDTLGHELHAGEYFVEDFAPGKGKDPCPDRDRVQEIWPRVEILIAIANLALATGYEHLVGKDLDLLLVCGEHASGKLTAIRDGLLHLVDSKGVKMTIAAGSIAGTEADPPKNG